jgi:MYXO-CTERM domain-containing protein
MDESDLRDRLERIERRQHLVLVVLVVPYLVGIAYVIGFPTAGVLYAAFGLVAFVLVAVRRRRSRNAAGQ